MQHVLNIQTESSERLYDGGGVDTYQSDSVAGPLERVHGGRMWHVHYGDIVHLQYDVVDFESAVGGSGAAGYQLRDVYGSVVADVRVVDAAGDAEAEPRATSLQHDLLVFPLAIAVNLQQHTSITNHPVKTFYNNYSQKSPIAVK